MNSKAATSLSYGTLSGKTSGTAVIVRKNGDQARGMRIDELAGLWRWRIHPLPPSLGVLLAQVSGGDVSPALRSRGFPP